MDVRPAPNSPPVAAGAAVAAATGAMKLIDAIHGNGIPHRHTHRFPRRRGDAFDGKPIALMSAPGRPMASEVSGLSATGSSWRSRASGIDAVPMPVAARRRTSGAR